jgi:hypothetical protein
MHCRCRLQLFLAEEVDHQAMGTGTSGTARTVDVILLVLRWVKVDHSFDAGNMHATSSNVGREQRNNVALGPTLERGLTGVL